MTPVPRKTPLYRLLEIQLGEDLEAFVTSRRAAGVNWRDITAEVVERTGTEVPHVSLFRWFADEDDNGDEAPAA
jgi:hypothetical protein